jgi:hypothetical protein
MAGRLDSDFRFEFEGKPLTAKPVRPDGTPLKSKDRWVGPRPGIPYVLAAGGGDIYYETPALTAEDPPTIRPSTTRRVQLSKVIGEKSLLRGALAPISAVRGHQADRNPSLIYVAQINRGRKIRLTTPALFTSGLRAAALIFLVGSM